MPGRMGEWRRESGKRKETTCDRRQLLKNKHSTTHGARKARHPALRLPAVSVGFDIPLGDAGGESHAKNHPTRNLAKVTVSPLQTRSNLTASFFFFFWKTQLPSLHCSIEKIVFSALQINTMHKRKPMTCQCLHLDACLGSQATLRHCRSHAGNGPHRNWYLNLASLRPVSLSIMFLVPRYVPLFTSSQDSLLII